jgi:tetratricopeptide (TPR) repeat protein
MMITSYAPAAREVNRLPLDSRLLFFGESRSYYFQRPVTAATVFDTQPLLVWLDTKNSAQEVWEELRGQGYTHLFVQAQEALRTRNYEPYRWSDGAVARWNELQAHFLAPVFASRDQVLYAVLPHARLDRQVKQGRPLFAYAPEVIGQMIPLFKQAVQALQQGRLPEAEALGKRCQELTPGWEQTYLFLGDLYYQENRQAESLRSYEQADAMAVLEAPVYNNLAAAYLNRQQYAKAGFYLRRALEQDPTLETARQNLSILESEFPAQVRPGGTP